jgi:hypothetical protein
MDRCAECSVHVLPLSGGEECQAESYLPRQLASSASTTTVLLVLLVRSYVFCTLFAAGDVLLRMEKYM